MMTAHSFSEIYLVIAEQQKSNESGLTLSSALSRHSKNRAQLESQAFTPQQTLKLSFTHLIQ